MVPCERNTLTYEFSTGPVRSLVVAYIKKRLHVRREPDVSFNTTDMRGNVSASMHVVPFFAFL